MIGRRSNLDTVEVLFHTDVSVPPQPQPNPTPTLMSVFGGRVVGSAGVLRSQNHPEHYPSTTPFYQNQVTTLPFVLSSLDAQPLPNSRIYRACIYFLNSYLPVHSCECVCFHFSAYCIENDINTTYLCGFEFWSNFLDRQFPLWLVLASRAEAGQIKLTSAIDHQLTIKLRFTFNCVSLEVQVCEKGWTNRIDFCKYDHQLKCANV